MRELERLKYDVFFLQETHVSCKQQAEAFERLWRGKCFWSFGTGKSAGVAIIFSPIFSGKILRYVFDSDGRIFSILIEFGSTRINLVNIYAPNVISDRKLFFENLHDYFLSQGDLIIGGDFNCVDSASDKFQSNEIHSTDKNSLCSLKSHFSLVDVWRKCNPREISFTWSNSNNTQASRLDRFFISKSLFSRVRECKIFPCAFSDHDFVDLFLNIVGLSNRRSNIWKFNSSLLSDPGFMQMMTGVITKHKLEVNKFDSLGDWWDNLKIVIRLSCIDFSVKKRKKINARRSALTKELIRAKQKLFSGDQDAAAIVKSLECDLSSLIINEAEGAKIRSKAEWIEKGEKPTRYFSVLRKSTLNVMPLILSWMSTA